jgi:hypothetical protein
MKSFCSSGNRALLVLFDEFSSRTTERGLFLTGIEE